MAVKTVQVRAEPDMAEQLRWLAEHEQMVAAKKGRKPRPIARILKDLAGQKVANAYSKIQPWVESVKAAMDSEPVTSKG